MSQIQPVDYSVRRKAILTISAATVIGGLFIVVFESHRSGLEKWFLEEPERMREKLNWMLVALAVSFTPLFLVVVYFWRIGQSVINARRFPPPGATVVIDTPVITGAKAVFRGRLFKFGSLFLTVCAFAVPIVLWWIIQRLLGDA